MRLGIIDGFWSFVMGKTDKLGDWEDSCGWETWYTGSCTNKC